jgi:DNA-binding LacI/PurR family transcriptional regulator
MTANLRDLSRDVRISSAAISNYLKDPTTKHVGKKTKTRIDEAVRRLNYRTNVIAKSLSSRKSDVISVLIPYDLPFSNSSFLNEILAGLESALLKKNYNMLFPATHGHDSATMVRNQIAKGFGFDGYVLFGTRFCSRKDVEINAAEIAKSGFPAVTVNMPELDHPVGQVVSVTPEECQPTHYLIEHGHRRILLVAGTTKDLDSMDNIAAWKRCHRKAAMPIDQRLIVYGGYERATASATVERALDEGLRFSAIYCLSDTMALGAYDALGKRRLRVPKDVSVVGKNDSPFAGIMRPALTTLRIRLFEIGKIAGEMLLSAIQTGKPPGKIDVPNEIVVRESVADAP